MGVIEGTYTSVPREAKFSKCPFHLSLRQKDKILFLMYTPIFNPLLQYVKVKLLVKIIYIRSNNTKEKKMYIALPYKEFYKKSKKLTLYIFIFR